MKLITFRVNPNFVIYPARIKRVLCNMDESELLNLLKLDDTPVKGSVPTAVRVSDECYKKLKEVSRKYGVTVSDLARKACVYKDIPKYSDILAWLICNGLMRFSSEEILKAPEYSIYTLPKITLEYGECKKKLDELKVKTKWRANIVKRKVLYLVMQDGGYPKLKDLICTGLKRYSIDEIKKAKPYAIFELPEITENDGECYEVLNKINMDKELIKQKVLTLVLRDGGWKFTKN